MDGHRGGGGPLRFDSPAWDRGPSSSSVLSKRFLSSDGVGPTLHWPVLYCSISELSFLKVNLRKLIGTIF